MWPYALPPLTREERAASAKGAISTRFNNKQQVFLDFVLSHYVRVGVEELDQEKLTPLLRLKYHNSIADALVDLGRAEEIGQVFAGFQKYLYQHTIGCMTRTATHAARLHPRTQWRSVSDEQLIFAAIDRTASHCGSCSRSCASTIRTARSHPYRRGSSRPASIPNRREPLQLNGRCEPRDRPAVTPSRAGRCREERGDPLPKHR